MRSSDKEHWLKAIADELKAVRAMNCYDLLVSQSLLPKGANLIGFTWVFRIKIHEDGTVARFKARICVDGSRQIYGLDFEETFAPVANAATIRLVLAVAVHNDMTLRQFDIKLAFVSANIDRPVYMRSPTGSGEPLGSVWKLKRSLYGLRQAPRLFNAKLHATLCAFGWKQSKHDPCLYILRKGKHFSFLVAVVDDLLLATTNSSVCKTFYSNMSRVFDFKDMGAPCYMIGMHLRRSGPKLRISQQQYIRDIAHRHSSLLLNCHPATTPAVASFKMVKTGLYRSDPSPLVDSKLYRSLIGALMYAIITRPDISTTVSMCARFLAAPTQVHLDQAVRILAYLVNTIELSLTFTQTAAPTLRTYVDASWAADNDTRRSRFGYGVYYGRALVCWKSKLHSCICLSTAEAEYVGATEATKDTMWLRFLLADMGLALAKPTTLYEDNQACMKMATNKIVSARNKHLELKMHFVRERVDAGDICLQYISTTLQRADLLTKNLPRPSFERFRTLLLDPPEFVV
jgi:hypothetical protein